MNLIRLSPWLLAQGHILPLCVLRHFCVFPKLGVAFHVTISVAWSSYHGMCNRSSLPRPSKFTNSKFLLRVCLVSNTGSVGFSLYGWCKIKWCSGESKGTLSNSSNWNIENKLKNIGVRSGNVKCFTSRADALVHFDSSVCSSFVLGK